MSDRRGLAVVALAAAALAVLWRALPGVTPPVYDGLCIADAYRVLGHSPGPSSATMTFPAGSVPNSEVGTTESPAQAQLLLMDGAFSASSAVTVTITPVKPPGAKPANGAIDGNVYRYAAKDASRAALTAQNPVTVLLRGTRSNPARSIERLDGTTWTQLHTFVAGCGDLFAAVSNRLGDFAVVVTGTPPSSAPGSGPPVAAIAGILVVVLIAAVLLLIRLQRSRR